jgi:hypothetical protein
MSASWSLIFVPSAFSHSFHDIISLIECFGYIFFILVTFTVFKTRSEGTKHQILHRLTRDLDFKVFIISNKRQKIMGLYRALPSHKSHC